MLLLLIVNICSENDSIIEGKSFPSIIVAKITSIFYECGYKVPINYVCVTDKCVSFQQAASALFFDNIITKVYL